MTIEFKGWDWTELLPLLNLEEEYKARVEDIQHNMFEAEAAFAKEMAEQICSYPYNHTKEETALFIQQLRAFLQKIVDLNIGYDAPYFQGILNVQSDEVFLQCYAHNLTWMWT